MNRLEFTVDGEHHTALLRRADDFFDRFFGDVDVRPEGFRQTLSISEGEQVKQGSGETVWLSWSARVTGEWP